MRILYTSLSLAPAPLFFLGFLYSALVPPQLCTSFPYEMTVMWFIMALAHIVPWLVWFQQRDLARRA
jgi:hypothetical protein